MPSSGPPITAVVVALVLTLAMLIPVACVTWRAHRARRTLRTCPRCGACATRDVQHQQVSPTTIRVVVQCGQCATRRRVVVEDVDRDVQQRRLARDRRAMCRQLRRLEAAEIRGFIALLRADVEGADDFLARTRPLPARPTRTPGDP